MNINIGQGGFVKVITVYKEDRHIEEAEKLYNFVKEKELFEAKLGEIYSHISYSGDNIVLLGLGEKDKVTADSLRKAFYKLGRKLIKLKIESIGLKVPAIENNSYKQAVQAVTEGLLQSEYNFEKYLTKKKHIASVKDVFLDILDGKQEDAKQAINEATNLVDGIFLARNIVNEPAAKLTPRALSATAKEKLENLGVKVDLYGKEQISQLGMGAFLAVSQGSAQEPQLIVMTWNGNKDSDEKIALVGKGITYDSGGYSIKPTDSMVTMNSDMAGSATVMGAMHAIAKSNLKQNVVAIVAACENMISGSSYKPGDIVRSMSGKTIEILNTDAEGRVTLADALWYATSVEKATKIIDVATLTGACVVALGDLYTGAITNNDSLMQNVKDAADLSGELIWELPSNDQYKELIKGSFADLKNTGGRGAGTITAGLFLQEFVDDTPWVHLDIAGTAYLSEKSEYLAQGATGVLVKTLYYLVQNSM